MVSSLKSWSYDSGIYVSPAFPDYTSFNRAKRFFIRAQVTIDADERNRIIRIAVDGKPNAHNLAQLRKLHLIDM